MNVDTSHRDRTSVRQAILVVQAPAVSDWAAALSIPLLLDVIGSAVAVNGATLAAGCLSNDQARPLAEILPADVELLVPPVSDRPVNGIWFVKQFAARGFDRVLLVAADSIGLSARILTTALSVLASEPLVYGPVRTGGAYLAGLQTGAGRVENQDTAGLIESLTTSQVVRIAGSRMEPRDRLRDLNSVESFLAAAAGHERLLRRSLAFIESGKHFAGNQPS